MGLGLGTRIGEYKSPEVQSGHLRRPYSSLSKDYNQINCWCIDINSDSSNERAYTSEFNQLEESDVITVTLEFNADDVSDTRMIFSINESIGADRVISIYHHQSRLHAALTADDFTSKVGKRSGSTTSDNTWYHVIATFDLASESVTLYLNGAVQTDTTNATNGMLYGNAIHVGRAIASDGSTLDPYLWYVGKIRQIAVWQNSLSSSQIKALWFEGKPRNPLNMARGGAARWPDNSSTDPYLMYYIPVLMNSNNFPSQYPTINVATFNSAGVPATWRGGLQQDNGVIILHKGLFPTLLDSGDYMEGYYGE